MDPRQGQDKLHAGLHSDAFCSVFVSVCFGSVSADLSGWQMRDGSTRPLDNHVEHPRAHASTDKCTYKQKRMTHATFVAV